MSNKRYLTSKDFKSFDIKGLCRICKNPLPLGRRVYCSNACSDACRALMSVSYQVSLVHERDMGICALCGFDSGKLQRIYQHALRFANLRNRNIPVHYLMRQFMKELHAPKPKWQMDHILPICEGGGVFVGMTVEQLLANLRTLCLECHKAETKKLAARRAAKPK